MNNVEGRWLGNIYEHFSLKFRNVLCGKKKKKEEVKQLLFLGNRS